MRGRRKPFHCPKSPKYFLLVLSEWIPYGNKTKQKKIGVLISCTHGVLMNHLHIHSKDGLFHCRLCWQSLNIYQTRSCFISSHNTVKGIKLTSVPLYSPREVIELGGDAWDGRQGRIWLIIKQLQRNPDLNLRSTDSMKGRNSIAPREKWPFIVFLLICWSTPLGGEFSHALIVS